MREIKFRAYDVEKEKMINAEHLAFEEYAPLVYLLNRHGLKMMQYTGLKDKNRTEIYECDIVLLDDSKYVVKYDLGEFYLDSKLCNTSIFQACKGEIIGNLYEDPDLL